MDTKWWTLKRNEQLRNSSPNASHRQTVVAFPPIKSKVKANQRRQRPRRLGFTTRRKHGTETEAVPGRNGGNGTKRRDAVSGGGTSRDQRKTDAPLSDARRYVFIHDFVNLRKNFTPQSHIRQTRSKVTVDGRLCLHTPNFLWWSANGNLNQPLAANETANIKLSLLMVANAHF